MPDPTAICPSCDQPRVEQGDCRTHAYDNGLWIGCTACGLSVSGPLHDTVRAAWAALCRSTAIRTLRDAAPHPSPFDDRWESRA